MLFAKSALTLTLSLLQSGAGLRSDLGVRSPFKGAGLSGQDCKDSLRIYAHYLDFNADETACRHVTYIPIEKQPNVLWTYKLQGVASDSCPSRVLRLWAPQFGDTAWHVETWKAVAAWRKKTSGNVSLCLME